MKWLAALVALALGRSAWGRSLKAFREPEARVDWSKDVEAENEELRKENRNLQSMMQMARAEVQRMDAATRAHKHRRGSGCDADTDVLKQEIEDLKKKLSAAEADKTDLVQSLRQMMAKNSTHIFQRQAERAQQEAARAQEMKMALEVKCGKGRQALEAQLQEANGKCDEVKETAQNLRDENTDLQKKLLDSRTEVEKTTKVNKELSSDKTNLVATMQGLMRENSRFKHGLQQEKELEKKEEKELAAEKAADKALAAKLAKPAPKPAVKLSNKTTSKVKAAIRHYRHQKLTDAEKAHLHEIDQYIDSASDESAGDVSEQQLQAVQKEGQLIASGKVGTHLSDWLGLKTDIKPKPALKVAPKLPAKPLDDEEEAEDLVRQAKAQLDAMERD